jgi:type IV secretion system protein VirB10
VSPQNDLPPDAAGSGAPIATRAQAPTPRRLSRKALATLAGVSAFAVAAALGYSLSTSHRTGAPQESVSVNRGQSDALADAPKDYGDVPRVASAAIGPPPATTEPVTTPPLSGPATTSSPIDNGASAERQRRRQSRESARASKLFAGTSEGARAPTSGSEAAVPPSGTSSADQARPGGTADAQDRKAAFVAGTTREPTVNSGRLAAPASRFVVSAGSTIAAALITGLSSDLPGQVVAQVTEEVFDTVSGRARLIPQGTRLIGVYDARVSYGQSRALVVWTRLIFPDGRSLDLDRMVGTDAAGQSGLVDRVDNHSGRLLMAGLLSTMFGVGANAATAGGGDNNDIAYAIRESAGRSVESAGDKIVGRQLDVQPSITIRPGARVRVLVSRDLVLTPWTGG